MTLISFNLRFIRKLNAVPLFEKYCKFIKKKKKKEIFSDIFTIIFRYFYLLQKRNYIFLPFVFFSMFFLVHFIYYLFLFIKDSRLFLIIFTNVLSGLRIKNEIIITCLLTLNCYATYERTNVEKRKK